MAGMFTAIADPEFALAAGLSSVSEETLRGLAERSDAAQAAQLFD